MQPPNPNGWSYNAFTLDNIHNGTNMTNIAIAHPIIAYTTQLWPTTTTTIIKSRNNLDTSTITHYTNHIANEHKIVVQKDAHGLIYDQEMQNT